MADLPWLTQMQLEKNGTFFSSDKLNTTNATNNLVDLVRMEVFGTVGQAILVFIYSLASILALTGNTLVILVELYGKRSAKNLRKFLINLAISDLLMGVISAPIVYTDVLLVSSVLGLVVVVIILLIKPTGPLDLSAVAVPGRTICAIVVRVRVDLHDDFHWNRKV